MPYTREQGTGIFPSFLIHEDLWVNGAEDAFFRSQPTKEMIIELSIKDNKSIFHIINTAAQVYKGVIPADCYHEPYMPEEELLNEMNDMTFFGWEESQELIGVIGFQPVRDVILIRHAYVHPQYQGKGIGTKLLAHLKQLTKTSRLLVGTWADASWAIHFYQKHGFTLQRNKDELLLNYWNISERQRETSVVLEIRTDR